VVERRDDGKVRITRKHETRPGSGRPRRRVGHAAAGMSRHDLKELGEHLDAGQAGLVVVGVSDMGAKIQQAMRRTEKLQAGQLKADTEAIEADAKGAGDASG
jgi:hypothetical protein